MPKRKITQVEFAPGLGEVGRVTTAKLRVAAYARVSTEKEEQEHSLEAQTDYFNSYIRNNPRWEFVGLYVDDGISGLSHQNRDGFNRMVGISSAPAGLDIIKGGTPPLYLITRSVYLACGLMIYNTSC